MHAKWVYWMFFFTCWLWISYWKLNILAIIYRLLTHFQFCEIYNFEFSRACKIMKQFILALQNRAFCRLINWNHFVNLCLYVKTVLRCLFLTQKSRSMVKIKIIWKILFLWNIISLLKFYLTIKNPTLCEYQFLPYD